MRFRMPGLVDRLLTNAYLSLTSPSHPRGFLQLVLFGLIVFSASMWSAATADELERYTVTDTSTMLPEWPYSVGVQLNIGGGSSENLSESRPSESVPFSLGKSVLAWGLQIRGYRRSLGGTFSMNGSLAPISFSPDSLDNASKATTFRIELLASYHHYGKKALIRVEPLFGVGYMYDAASTDKFMVDEQGSSPLYHANLSGFGPIGGVDFAWRVASHHVFHSLYTYASYSVAEHRWLAELLLPIRSELVEISPYRPGVSDLFIVIGARGVWKEDRRTDRLIYIGFNVGNWSSR